MPLQIIRQDITKLKVDAIVNTTNEQMIGHSGVDLAVHTIAGPELDAECASLAPLGLGCAKITKGYRLPAKYVIHTSGPVWRGGLIGESIILRSCYIESLKLAVDNKCRSVAFPLISSGRYGYPKDQILKYAMQVIAEFLLEHEIMVYICVYDKDSYSFSQKLFNDIRSYIDDQYVEDHNTVPRAESNSSIRNRSSSGSSAPHPTAENKTSELQNSANGKTLHEYLMQKDQSFQKMLFDLIDESGMTDVECYKKANLTKCTFSKIKVNADYHPSKSTAVAFAISLELDLADTQKFLATAGYTLSGNLVFDKIIRYFIQNNNYNIFEINEALFEFDQVLLGSGWKGI